MTGKPKGGTLSTRGSSDKKVKKPKETNATKKMKDLLGVNKVLFVYHANMRMGQRNVIDYEIRQALSKARHDPSRDRYSWRYENWEYSFEGKTQDSRHLRIGVCFETTAKGERLLVITVVDPNN